MGSSDVHLRPGRETDFVRIAAIHEYYVLNTVLTFSTTPSPAAELVDKFRATLRQGLPFIVAADSDDAVIGYAYASGFRGTKAGYRRTVELSLFFHPEHRGRGAGGFLLNKLLDALRSPADHLDFTGGNLRPSGSEVHQVLACMAVDTEGRRNGLALKEFYERHGFELRGHLRGVGHKFDRWIDTMYLQKTL